jgi:hypothetical protein
MSAMTPADKNSPLMIAWTAYKLTDDFANTRKWAFYNNGEHVDGSLWAAFMEGFNAAARSADWEQQAFDAIKRLATARADERERCKQICLEEAKEWDSDAVQLTKNYADWCASRIGALTDEPAKDEK